ncbi:SH3 domain-containing protein [Methylovorus mays]|uniref:SH3 domain-containing protein n=1 Tax=Methylovorus mays TaxID=184077 RepID=UPI001E32F438|nr:SH3 domain-containing protein [Methylovorus mays]MCB5205606.1 SH3 domain-containing protein [Methylovorus mays]
MRYFLSASLAAILFASSLAQAESGTALKNDTLRKEPYNDAKTSGQLKRGDKVDIVRKQGAWLQVKSAKTSGWVRLLSVRRAASTGNQAAGVLSVASGRAGTGQVVATTGVRGLTEDELKQAQFSEPETKLLESYSVSAADGAQYAKAGGLKPIKLGYLPKPVATQGENP